MSLHCRHLLALILAFICGRVGFAQSQPSSPSDSTIYRVVIDSVYPKGEMVLARQFYNRHGVPLATESTLHTVLPPANHRIQWIDSTAVVSRGPDGAAVIRFAVQFTRIAYVTDGRTAILYFRDICGGVCGSEREAVVAQDLKGRWRVAGLVTTALY